MADSIRVTLSPDRLVVQPDSDPIETTITIQNNGATVDQYAVELDQLPTTWYTLSNTSVALFPQDKEEAKLVVHPPKGAAAKAGNYPFSVTVLSRADSTQTTRVDGMLQVGTVGAFDAVIAPSKLVGRRGKYMLHLNNGGNADVNVELSASDPGNKCRFQFQPQKVTLVAGMRSTVPVTVRPRRNWLVGSRKNFDFQVKATPDSGATKMVTGVLVHKPMFRTLRPLRNLLILLVLLILLLFGLRALNGNGGVNGATWKNNAVSYSCKHLNLLCNQVATATPAPTATPKPRVIVKPKPKPKPIKTYPFIGAFKDFHKLAPTLVGQG
ncbi:MAG TPA: hypothetical protein VNL71_17990, partial [Chloroflexota bacterium]|nr:hypothetical protein [Chloroflexota bacterium]